MDNNENAGARTRLAILEMGLMLWRVDPSMVNARRIAHELNMTHGTVFYHFKSSIGLQDAIAFHAVKQGETKVIAQLVMQKHKAVAHLTEAQRLEYLKAAAA